LLLSVLVWLCYRHNFRRFVLPNGWVNSPPRVTKITALHKSTTGGFTVEAELQAWRTFRFTMASFHPTATNSRRSKSAMILLSGSFSAPAVMSALYRISATAVLNNSLQDLAGCRGDLASNNLSPPKVSWIAEGRAALSFWPPHSRPTGADGR
jgi:hypothetical protein